MKVLYTFEEASKKNLYKAVYVCKNQELLLTVWSKSDITDSLNRRKDRKLKWANKHTSFKDLCTTDEHFPGKNNRWWKPIVTITYQSNSGIVKRSSVSKS